LTIKEFKLSEQSEFLNSRQIRAAQGSPPLADRVNGCPFGSFWASKMNKKHLGKTFYYILEPGIIFYQPTRKVWLGPPAELVV